MRQVRAAFVALAMLCGSVAHADRSNTGFIDFLNLGIAPASPPANVFRIYSTSSGYYYKDHTGTVHAVGGGGGSGTATDLQTSTTVVSISGSAAPANKYVLVATDSTDAAWRQLTLDDLGAAFAISSFAAGGNYAATSEIGDTLASPITFTASYTSIPASATIVDGINSTVTLTTPFTSATESHAYSKSVPNQTVVWTLTAIGATTKTATVTAAWRGRVYYGIATPSTINSSFVTSLPSSGLQSGFTNTYAIGAGSNTKKAYIFFDDAFGTPTIFKDAATGFAVPMTCTASAVTVVNAFSVSRTLEECVSDNLLNASFSLQVQ